MKEHKQKIKAPTEGNQWDNNIWY